jgi:hypothetical protein
MVEVDKMAKTDNVDYLDKMSRVQVIRENGGGE